MVTVESTAATTTFQKGVCGPASSPFDSTDASYVDVTDMSISSVPNNSKIYYSFTIQKLTSGNVNWRLTDNGTNIFASGSSPSSSINEFSSFDGSALQNSGSASTVKLQIQSDGTNIGRVYNDTNYSSWFCVSDMTGGDPIIITPTSTSAMTGRPFVFNGKRQVDELYVYHPPGAQGTSEEFSVNVMGYNKDSAQTDATVEDVSFSPNVMTSELSVYPGIEAPIWKGNSASGRGAVIISWTGFNVEVTG